MTNAQLAQGAIVEFGGTPIPEVTTLDMPSTTAEVDVTSHDSPGRTREFISGLIDPGGIPMTVNWNIADHGFLYDIKGDSSAVDTLTVEEADSSETYSVQAWLRDLNIHEPATGEARTADLVFGTSGPQTRAGS